MDPATAIQLFAIGVDSCVKLKNLLQELYHAPGSIKALAKQFKGLAVLLQAFQEAWTYCESEALEVYVKELFDKNDSALRRLEKACKIFEQQKKEGKLQNTVHKFLQGVTYVSKKDILHSLIHDASEFSRDVGSLMQVCFFYKEREQLGHIINAVDTLGKQVLDLQSSGEDNILRWVLKSSSADSSDYDTVHQDTRKHRSTSTCRWLFSTPEWNDFRQASNSLLWVYGIAGSGKSVLCSSVIDEVIDLAKKNTDLGYAYYYFSRAGIPQTLDNCLTSLIHQLCLQYSYIPVSLRDAYRRGKLPATEELMSTLQDLLKRSQTIFLVFDALDECTQINDRDSIIKWLQSLQRDQSAASINIVITSRDQRDIRDVLREMQATEVNLDHSRNCEDIQNYVQKAIFEHRKLKKVVDLHKSLGEDIIKKLVGDANGMFLLASSRVHILQNVRGISLRSIRETLEGLPSDINGVYDQILMSIPQESREEAIRALCWLAIAHRPLTIEELAEACVVDPDAEDTLVDPEKKLIDPEEVLELVSDFVTVRKRKDQPRVVQLAHATIHEYIRSDHIRNLASGAFQLGDLATEAFLARSCIKYLFYSHENLLEHVEQQDDLFPLSDYVSSHWYVHFKGILEDKHASTDYHEVEGLALNFLTSEQIFAAWRITHTRDEEGYPERLTRFVPPKQRIRNGSPLYYAACLGLPFPCISKLANKYALDASTGSWGTPMLAAAENHRPSTVRFLLSLGANPRIANRLYGNILIACTANLLPDLAIELIRKHVVDLRDCHGSALHWAIHSEQNDVARELIAAGAPIHAIHPPGRFVSGTPLILAARFNNCEIIELLHQRGVNLNQMTSTDLESNYFSHITALQTAVESTDSLQALQLLLKLKADVNVTKGHWCAPVCCAARKGNVEAVRALLDAGADIHTYYTARASPLWVALCWGQRDAALMLLGADARMPGLSEEIFHQDISAAGGRSNWVDTQIRNLEPERHKENDRKKLARESFHSHPLKIIITGSKDAEVKTASKGKAPSRPPSPPRLFLDWI